MGPTLALAFGWQPVWLWIVIGGIFFGAVHDMVTLFTSVREGGRTIGRHRATDARADGLRPESARADLRADDRECDFPEPVDHRVDVRLSPDRAPPGGRPADAWHRDRERRPEGANRGDRHDICVHHHGLRAGARRAHAPRRALDGTRLRRRVHRLPRQRRDGLLVSGQHGGRDLALHADGLYLPRVRPAALVHPAAARLHQCPTPVWRAGAALRVGAGHGPSGQDDAGAADRDCRRRGGDAWGRVAYPVHHRRVWRNQRLPLARGQRHDRAAAAARERLPQHRLRRHAR